MELNRGSVRREVEYNHQIALRSFAIKCGTCRTKLSQRDTAIATQRGVLQLIKRLRFGIPSSTNGYIQQDSL
jgi:hypothetical protein